MKRIETLSREALETFNITLNRAISRGCEVGWACMTKQHQCSCNKCPFSVDEARCNPYESTIARTADEWEKWAQEEVQC